MRIDVGLRKFPRFPLATHFDSLGMGDRPARSLREIGAKGCLVVQISASYDQFKGFPDLAAESAWPARERPSAQR